MGHTWRFMATPLRPQKEALLPGYLLKQLMQETQWDNRVWGLGVEGLEFRILPLVYRVQQLTNDYVIPWLRDSVLR